MSALPPPPNSNDSPWPHDGEPIGDELEQSVNMVCGRDPALCPHVETDDWVPRCAFTLFKRIKWDGYVTPRRVAEGCLAYPKDELTSY